MLKRPDFRSFTPAETKASNKTKRKSSIKSNFYPFTLGFFYTHYVHEVFVHPQFQRIIENDIFIPT